MDKSTDETRRSFCVRAASLAVFGGALGTVLPGCASPTSPSNVPALPSVSASVSGRSLLVTVDAASPLATVGGAALVQSSLGTVLVARTDQNTFTALNSTCTHDTCTITGIGSQHYVCPCHGSEFDTSGRVLVGPAPRNLTSYATQFTNNLLTISV